MKLLEVFHKLKVKPKIETPQDLESFAKHFAHELEHDISDAKEAEPKTKAHNADGEWS